MTPHVSPSPWAAGPGQPPAVWLAPAGLARRGRAGSGGRFGAAASLLSAVLNQPVSLIGMALAAAGYLPPAAGAVIQGVIDVLAAGNALRVALPPRGLTGYQGDCRQPGVGNNCTPGGPAPPTPVG